MQLKPFIQPLKNLSVPEAAMNAFRRSHRMLAVKKVFVPHGENSFWTFCVEYLSSPNRAGALRLGRRSKVRFKRKFQRYEAAHGRGQWSELVLQQRMQALLAFVLPVESGAFRRQVLQRFACLPCDEPVSTHQTSARRRQGVAVKRLEPRESGRQLEQQRDQLPGGEPQQQQPDEPEQQSWVPFGPAPSSTRLPEGSGADPAAIPTCVRGAQAKSRCARPVSVAGPEPRRTLRAGRGRSLGFGEAISVARSPSRCRGCGIRLSAVRCGEREMKEEGRRQNEEGKLKAEG